MGVTHVTYHYARAVRGSVEFGLAFGILAVDPGTVDSAAMMEMTSNNGSHKDMKIQSLSTRSGAAMLCCMLRPREVL